MAQGKPPPQIPVGWVEVAQIVGGASQTDPTVNNAKRHNGDSTSDRSPTRATVCLTHPTIYEFPGQGKPQTLAG